MVSLSVFLCNASQAAGTDSFPASQLLKNSSFSDATNNWWGAGGTLIPVDGTGCLTFHSAGANKWDVILGQGGFGLLKGETYTVKFDIKADKDTKGVMLVQHDGAPYNQYISKNIDIGTDFDSHEYEFKYNAKSDPKVGFQFQLGAHKNATVCVDNVSLEGKPYEVIRNFSKLRANQVGYFSNGEKFAVLQSESKSPLEWQLRNQDGEVITKGRTIVFGENSASGEHVHQIDFSHITSNHSNLVVTVGSHVSHPFDINEHIYAEMSEDALKYFYHNRSGIEIKEAFVQRADLARPAGHPEDIASCFKGTDAKGNVWPGCDFSLDATKGWYDAGDHGKYLVNSGISTWTLLNLYERGQYSSNQSIPFADHKGRHAESGNGINDLLDEARWNIEFMMAMQVPAGKKTPAPVGDQHNNISDLKLTEIDAGGMAFHKIADDKWTGFPTAPHNDKQHRSLSHPSTSATLNLAAVTAQCARIWRNIDGDFANQCLTSSKRAWNAARANPNVYAYDNFTGSGPYGDATLEDEFYWAAAELFITTGKKEYGAFVTDSPEFLAMPKGDIKSTGDFFWQYMAPAGTLSLALVPNNLPIEQVEQARKSIVKSATAYSAQVDTQGYRLPYQVEEYTWGSNSNIVNRAIILVYGFDYTGQKAFLVSATNAMDYILGRNPLSYSYVTGYGEDAYQNPHHRFWAYQADNNSPKPPAGVLSGGPNSINFSDPIATNLRGKCTGQTCYVDDIGAWSLNEVTINWNSPLVWITTALNDNKLK
ncbi:glycoside hydrolase family 9 protein [Vibrio hippocampi]|nr:glycoside hydrolase family 9 protein [Vibrio hippocampi]